MEKCILKPMPGASTEYLSKSENGRDGDRDGERMACRLLKGCRVFVFATLSLPTTTLRNSTTTEHTVNAGDSGFP